jgi:uncharacterized protein (UPF0261 family)
VYNIRAVGRAAGSQINLCAWHFSVEGRGVEEFDAKARSVWVARGGTVYNENIQEQIRVGCDRNGACEAEICPLAEFIIGI